MKDFWIAQHFAVVLANDDRTGLQDCEEKWFDKWYKFHVEPHGYLVVTDDHTEGKCDVTRLYGSLVRVELIETTSDPMRYGSPEHQAFGDAFLYKDEPGAW